MGMERTLIGTWQAACAEGESADQIHDKQHVGKGRGNDQIPSGRTAADDGESADQIRGTQAASMGKGQSDDRTIIGSRRLGRVSARRSATSSASGCGNSVAMQNHSFHSPSAWCRNGKAYRLDGVCPWRGSEAETLEVREANDSSCTLAGAVVGAPLDDVKWVVAAKACTSMPAKPVVSEWSEAVARCSGVEQAFSAKRSAAGSRIGQHTAHSQASALWQDWQHADQLEGHIWLTRQKLVADGSPDGHLTDD